MGLVAGKQAQGSHWFCNMVSCIIISLYHNVIRIEIKCTNNCDALESSGNHLPPPPQTSPWKNCLPQNQSLVPKRLGTTVLHVKLGLWFCLMSLSQLFGLRCCGFCFFFFYVFLRHQSTTDILILLFFKMHHSLIPIGLFIQNLVQTLSSQFKIFQDSYWW